MGHSARLTLGLAIFTMWQCSLPLTGFAQTVQGDTPLSGSSGASGGVLIRGTTGSGEQEAVFDDSDFEVGNQGGNENSDLMTTATPTSRDTSDPELQLQGRALAVQPEPPIIDPLRTEDPGARSNVRMMATQQGTAVNQEEDPFAASGFRIGSWRAFISAEQTLGYSSNTRQIAMGEGGAFSQSDVSLSLQSDWSRHSANINANGTWRRFLENGAEDQPGAEVSAGLTLDLVDGVSADAALSYNYATESATSNNINDSAANRPGVHSFEAALGIERNDRRLIYALRGSVGRTDYEAIDLAGGGEESQGDRNNTLYTLTGRVGYQVSPALTPFVEGSIGQRLHDLEKDRNGQSRDATILSAAVGTQIDISEKLQGEVSLGYQAEQFEDDGLEDLDGWTLNGNLTWSPQRETTVNLTASTGFEGSTTAGVSGSIVNSLGVSVERQVNDRLSLDANAGVELTRDNDDSQSDTTYSVGAGFNYWLNRFMGLTGRVEHSAQRSTAGPGEEFDETVIRGGLRFQR